MKNLMTGILLTVSLMLIASCVRQVPRTEPLAPSAPPVNQTAANIATTPPNEITPPAPANETANMTIVPANTTVVSPSAPIVQLPEEKPAIYEELRFPMSGELYKLYIYADGTAYSVAEKGLRMPVQTPTRTWKKGQVSETELKQILALFQSEQFSSLNGS